MKFLKRLKFKKTWPYLLAMILLEIGCLLILISFDYGLANFEFIDEVVGVVGGIELTYRQVIVIIVIGLCLYLIFSVIKFIWMWLFETIINKMRSNDEED